MNLEIHPLGTGERLKALEEALTPSAETKAAYIGEFHFAIGEGEYGSRIIPVPWTTIKEIMKAISARAADADPPQAIEQVRAA